MIMIDLDRLNAWSQVDARGRFLGCCGSTRWANEMAKRRPFADGAALLHAAEEIWRGLTPADWLQAFAAHPKIGDFQMLRAKYSGADGPASEQAGVIGASEEVLEALAAGNAAYEARFGYIFIVCATGKSAAEVLALLLRRLKNDPDQELLIAGNEQQKITHLRLRKVCA
jgi:2-oxo-4-hydroxy-4-carboxy-5-ureidoimidazoline decarboxylase